MPISFRCSNPECGRTMRAPDGTAGRKAKCPLCNMVQTIPQPEPDDLPTFGADPEDSPAAVPPPTPSKPGSPFTTAPQKQSNPTNNQAGQIHCLDCKKQFSASTMVCPNCGWVNQQAMGGVMPIAAKPATGGMMKEYLRAFTYGYSNFGSLLKLVSCSITMMLIFYFIFIFSFIFALLGGFFGVLLFVGILIACQLTMGGFFLRFYLDCIISSLEGIDQAPEVPDFQFGELCKVGLKGFGIVFVYVFPLITIPLLPLGLLALGYSDDLRAFDVKWALKAALKKPKQLGQLWLMLIFWCVIGGLIVEVSERTAAFVIEMTGNAIGEGVGVSLAKFLCLGIAAFFISGVSQMFMAIMFRCIGLFGHSESDVISSLPEETSIPVATGYITGGVIASVCVFTVLVGIAIGEISDIFSFMQPAQEDAELIEAEEPKYKHKEKPGDYLGLTMRGLDSGRNSASAQTMQNLGKAFAIYETQNDKYPETLDDLVEADLVGKSMIFSEQAPSKPIVYHMPYSRASGDWVLAYDPKPQFGDMFAVLFKNGSVKTISDKELDRLLKKQGSPAVE